MYIEKRNNKNKHREPTTNASTYFECQFCQHKWETISFWEMPLELESLMRATSCSWYNLNCVCVCVILMLHEWLNVNMKESFQVAGNNGEKMRN